MTFTGSILRPPAILRLLGGAGSTAARARNWSIMMVKVLADSIPGSAMPARTRTPSAPLFRFCSTQLGHVHSSPHAQPEPASKVIRLNGGMDGNEGIDKLLATEGKVDGQFLAVKNELRALASKVQHINPGKLEEKFGILEAVVRNCIDSFDVRLTDAASGGGSDARVASHTSDIARLSDTLDTMKNKLALAATRSDLNNLCGSVRDALEGVGNTIAEKLAPVDANAEEVVSQLAKLDARVARMKKKQEDGERIVTVRPGRRTVPKTAVQWTVRRRYGGGGSLMTLDGTGRWTGRPSDGGRSDGTQ
ncbi:hypothetical protein DFH09DRAFT_1071592 [Mycena vulgaris]|nr:hypothetical protein DFH09DRAFT_1071592 [Mycena vulgaris]